MHYELRETFYCDSKSQCTEHLFSPACNASGCGARRERIAALKRASAKAEAADPIDFLGKYLLASKAKGNK